MLQTLPRVPGADRNRIHALAAALDSDPRDLEAAAALATLYSQVNAASGDPRYLGYAEAVLRPWWEAPEPPLEAWLLRARIEQRLHRFPEAQADLEALLRAHPESVEASLLLSTVAIVRGDYDTARAACGRIALRASGLVAASCAASLAPYGGHGERGLEVLSRMLETQAPQDSDLGVWAMTLCAELAVGAGKPDVAGEYYRRAYAMAARLDATDLYLLGSYADFLIDQGRADEADRLLADAPQSDPLLIRLAVARAVEDPARARPLQEELAVRMRALQRREGDAHAREQAWFYLHVRHDPATALEFAQRNWRIQHEMRDARLLLEASLAADRPAAAAPVLDWIDARHIDHAWLNGLAQRLRAGAV